MRVREPKPNTTFAFRHGLVLAILAVGFAVLMLRAYDLQVLRKDFLSLQGDARQQRNVVVQAHRGMITDRNNEPLAISTPVDSIWVTPSLFTTQANSVFVLAKKLKLDPQALQRKLLRDHQREFVYVKRRLPPAEAQEVVNLNLPGVFLQREYRRYYPSAEVTAHVLGFTDIDDQGQEGIELAYNDWLSGHTGLKKVIQDRLGRVIEDLKSIKPSRPGRDLKLSLDKRLQYLSYRELKAAVKRHNAASGSAVILDSFTGEILAMVNQPAFNPHNRKNLRGENYRNRAVTDVFEPGSTIKPFTIAAGLDNQHVKSASKINTSPGYMMVSGHTIKDSRNHGVLNIKSILSLSSNVGASKLALSIPEESLWETYNRFGFGQLTGTGFPGESTGYLNHFNSWSKLEQATLAFGYGVAATTLQLARAYSVLANKGVMQPVSFMYQPESAKATRVVSAETAASLQRMLVSVVDTGGTGGKAQVAGYRVAGKTGTVRQSTANGYSEKDYVSLFAGMSPVSNPRLVMAVVINRPQGKEYYGGDVAAPVFASVMEDAMRLLNIMPDDPDSLYAKSPGGALVREGGKI